MTTLERIDGVGGELQLRRSGEDFEIISNGVFLMDTRNGESERLLVNAAAALASRGTRLLLGGLGVSFSLRAALDHPDVGEVLVVEREPAIIEWNRAGPLRAVGGDALADARVRVIEADLVRWLRAGRDRFDVICIDIDNGPSWTVTGGNAALYTDAGLASIANRLSPGGALGVWGAEADPAFTARLRAGFDQVQVLEVGVPRGEPDVIWLAGEARAHDG